MATNDTTWPQTIEIDGVLETLLQDLIDTYPQRCRYSTDETINDFEPVRLLRNLAPVLPPRKHCFQKRLRWRVACLQTYCCRRTLVLGRHRRAQLYLKACPSTRGIGEFRISIYHGFYGQDSPQHQCPVLHHLPRGLRERLNLWFFLVTEDYASKSNGAQHSLTDDGSRRAETGLRKVVPLKIFSRASDSLLCSITVGRENFTDNCW